ncbi:hypothetical protein Rhal01_01710 [Rubritalea halochordaticola]|uniref:SH3 domain-containing protein n=1 Tax=Rubritalea halochordaticola TaxID=714537 RepID=A0ABP9V4J3_9BACT
MKMLIQTLLISSALVMVSPADSLLNNDPDVVYMEEVRGKSIELLVIKPATIFASKKGGRRLGAYPVDTKVTLLAMTDKGYKVRGMAKHGKVSGWVSPKTLASKDPQFVENLKKFYERELTVRELISKNEVAIGMSSEEVFRSLGEPTRKESKITKDGQTGKWSYIDTEEVKHYTYVTDPRTGNTYRQLSHITTEEKGKVEVEFEKGIVTAISKMEDKGPGKVRVVVPPVIFGF